MLLTGPCGRIGYTTFTRLLQAGHNVRCFDTKTGYLSHPDGFNESIERFWRNKGYSFEWKWGDVRNANDVRQAVDDDIDAIIHHAAMTLPTDCEEEWEYCWDVNFFGTLNVIDAILASPRSPKLLYSSSVANYGYPVEGKEHFVESDPLTPTCTYAATKIACELAIRKAGINYTIMRIGPAPDVGAPHLAMMADPDYIARITKDKSYESPGHFVSFDDVNTAYLNALDNVESDRRTFNLVGPADCRTTFGSMLDGLSAALGQSPSPDDLWGSGPYPEHYYDSALSDSVLHYVRTGRAGIIANVQSAVDDIAEFVSLSAPG
ncbi:MAG: NAD-dependent epimerase/dehydratase family protein [Mycobacterium sp.]